ncbi:thioredoxin-like protein [Mucilaginibacter gracilis]|uniref:Thioredoxin-like protein n=1 Tax=Mucilaginibacter gracilis TaxID=423350 RepID=A0A495IVG7_9SPHI|nr:thioredoxin family protein [Mucilaginibacter gracilis]RKR80004.1 thioredoxin-like protein [Mucilaginibacter gracilis]
MKRTTILLILFTCISVQLNAQGINFDNSGSWNELKERAKAEQKYIFVDCFATWCGPCKEMDQNVYSSAEAGNAINSKFIAVKVQQDRLAIDDGHTKAWYNDAALILKTYHVDAFPTFLFFTPEGVLVHRASGGYDQAGFIALVADALDPQKQYVHLIEGFRQGLITKNLLGNLAISAKYAGDNVQAKEIADSLVSKLSDSELISKSNIEFLQNIAGDDLAWLKEKSTAYLAKLDETAVATPDDIYFILSVGKNEQLAEKEVDKYIAAMQTDQVFTRSNIEFISSTITSTHGMAFELLYENTKRIDQVMAVESFSQFTLDALIIRETVRPFIAEAERRGVADLDWKKIYTEVKKRFDKGYADRVLVKAKAAWYFSKGNAAQFAKYKIKELDLTAGRNVRYQKGNVAFDLNNDCWLVFQGSTKKSELNRALYWYDQLFKYAPDERKFPNNLDTYANLLYKAGRLSEAIALETQVVKKEPGNSDFAENLAKMKRGENTWPGAGN